MIKAVAFDIDGTLYNSFSFSLRCLPFIIKNLCFMIHFGIVRKEIRTINKNLSTGDEFFSFQAELLAKRLKWSPEYTKSFIEENVYIAWKELFKKIPPYKDALGTVKVLKNAGLKIGILSDFPPEQKNDIWGIARLSDVILGAEYCAALKPAKKPFLKLSEQLRVSPKEVLYVGNSYKYDIIGAKNVGMKTAYICSPFLKPFKRKKADIVFSNYKDLANILLNNKKFKY